MTSKLIPSSTLLLWSMALFLCLSGWGCDGSEESRIIEPDHTVLQVVNQHSAVSLFSTALKQAGLSDILKNQNISFTVFAPQNQAFDAYLQARGYTSLQEVPAAELNQLIGYHISLGKRLASALDSALLVDTYNDKKIFIHNTGNNIILNNQSGIVENNLLANNGVVHTIDQVLSPPTQTIAAYIATRATAEEAADFILLHAALQHAGMLSFLDDKRQEFTFFAPTDAAFMAAGYATVEDILNEDPAVLKSVLRYHLISRYRFASMFTNGNLTTLQGNSLSLNADNKTITGAGNAEAASLLSTEQDILTTNGILHAIDRVLLPE